MNVLVVDVGGTSVKSSPLDKTNLGSFPPGQNWRPNRWSPESRNSPGNGSMTRYRLATRGQSSRVAWLPNHVTSSQADGRARERVG